MRYAIVIEKAGNNFSGYVPDLPGCVATGATVKDTEAVLREQFGCADIADSFSDHLALEKKRLPQSGANAQVHESRPYDVKAQADHGTPCLSELEDFSGRHGAVVFPCALTLS